MTALNLFAGRDQAILLTDQGSFDANSEKITHLGSKVIGCQRLKLAIAKQGWGAELEEPITNAILDAATAAGFLAALPGIVRTHATTAVQFGIITWLDGPRCYLIRTPGMDDLPGPPPFMLDRVKTMASPAVDDDAWPQGELTVAAARKLIQAQRLRMGPGGKSIVAGAAEMVTVDANGVHHSIIAEWPEDRVGEAVDLFMPAWKCRWRRMQPPLMRRLLGGAINL